MANSKLHRDGLPASLPCTSWAGAWRAWSLVVVLGVGSPRVMLAADPLPPLGGRAAEAPPPARTEATRAEADPAVEPDISAPLRDGPTLFADLNCETCHSPDRDLEAVGLGRSLRQIAASYKGDKLGLLDFLNGGPPKINSAQYEIMKAPQAGTRKLSAEDKGTLADYLLTFGG